MERPKPQFLATCMYDVDSDSYYTFLEFERHLYRVYWTDISKLQCPPLPDFPAMPEGVRLEKVHMDRAMQDLLQQSTTIGCGADAMVRILDTDASFVVKCAFPTATARARLRHEYRMLEFMRELPLPVPRIIGDVLKDDHGMFAFRLPRLDQWQSNVQKDLGTAMQELATQLHYYGICHNDLRKANLMQTQMSTPMLIDFGRSGIVGDPVPVYLKDGMPGDRVFGFEDDLEAIHLLLVDDA